MTKLTLADVTNLYGNPTTAASTINANNSLIEDALENTLSRDGSTPNQMNSDLDMNHNDIINATTISTDILVLNGQKVTATGMAVQGVPSGGTSGQILTKHSSFDYDTVWTNPVSMEITPSQFGGVGDGINDDGPALNAMFDYIRALVSSAGNKGNIGLTVNLSGIWRTSISINATNITAWSLIIRGGLIVGECTGKAILDLVGSRGYTLFGVSFYGSKSNRPSCAYQLARPTSSGFCDDNSFIEVSTTGWYSRSAIHCYGHETTKHDHCTYFNYDYTARVAIFEGYNGTPFTSDYSTVMSGPTSFINNKVINCDFRYLPVDEDVVSVTGVTNTTSGVVTCVGHQFVNGDQVVFAFLGGMPNMSKQIATIIATTTNTVTVDVDTTLLGTFTGGGYMFRRQSQPSVYLSRAQQFNFDCSYIVSFGQPQLELAYPDNTRLDMDQIDLDLLMEGSGNNSNILFTTFGNSCSIQGLRFRTYNGNAVNAWFGISTGNIGLYQVDIQYVTPLYGSNIPIAGGGQEARIGVYGGSIVTTSLSAIPYSTMAALKAFITDIGSGIVYSRNITTL